MNKRMKTFYLDDKIVADIEALAKERNQSQSALVQEAIADLIIEDAMFRQMDADVSKDEDEASKIGHPKDND